MNRRPTPFVGSGVVEDLPVVLDVSGQVAAVGDVVPVEVFVIQRPEATRNSSPIWPATPISSLCPTAVPYAPSGRSGYHMSATNRPGKTPHPSRLQSPRVRPSLSPSHPGIEPMR